MSKATEVIALATVTLDGAALRGKIPTPVVRALKAKAGDVLLFERQPNGAVVVRKSTAAERKAAGR
jgi:DNA-directed RNA polymerase subunit H (RpoH/RPB5)